MPVKYRPSNGTEGDFFRARFCDRCALDTEDRPCLILARTMAFAESDPEYPAEWVMDDNDPRWPAPPITARCSAYAPTAQEISKVKLKNKTYNVRVPAGSEAVQSYLVEATSKAAAKNVVLTLLGRLVEASIATGSELYAAGQRGMKIIGVGDLALPGEPAAAEHEEPLVGFGSPAGQAPESGEARELSDGTLAVHTDKHGEAGPDELAELAPVTDSVTDPVDDDFPF